MNTFTFLLFAGTSLFAVIDPLGGIPFFSGLTAQMNGKEKRRTLGRALLVALGVLALFTFLGHEVLSLFGITVDAFRIAGGIIFFGIGLDMLQSRPPRWRTGINDDEDTPSSKHDDPSITPLGIPLIAGPGSITTVMILVPQAPGEYGSFLVFGSVISVLLLAGVILLGADRVLARVGSAGLKLIEKLMGLLVTVIAVQLVIDGLTPVIRGILAG